MKLKCVKCHATIDGQAFITAVKNNDEIYVRKMLRTERLDINSRDEKKRTALDYAVRKENVGMVRRLLKYPNIETTNSFLLALRLEKYKVVEMLMIHPSTFVGKAEIHGGWSALMYVASHNKPRLMRILLDKEADVWYSDNDCRTVFDVAKTEVLKKALYIREQEDSKISNSLADWVDYLKNYTDSELGEIWRIMYPENPKKDMTRKSLARAFIFWNV